MPLQGPQIATGGNGIDGRLWHLVRVRSAHGLRVEDRGQFRKLKPQRGEVEAARLQRLKLEPQLVDVPAGAEPELVVRDDERPPLCWRQVA
jgi:hypothetical protein